jgi:hypothetical protein
LKGEGECLNPSGKAYLPFITALRQIGSAWMNASRKSGDTPHRCGQREFLFSLAGDFIALVALEVVLGVLAARHSVQEIDFAATTGARPRIEEFGTASQSLKLLWIKSEK